MHRSFQRFFLVLCLSGVLFLATDSLIFACSRVLSANNGQAVLVGRNMDWPQNVDSAFWFLPKGLKREGLTEGKALMWTSKYNSIVLASSVKGMSFASEGINENGLEANLLWLDESDYGKRKNSRRGLSVALWAQYILDNYATVDEAVQAIKKDKFQIIAIDVPSVNKMERAYLHLALADKTGDSAIIEYKNGKPVVYHDRNYTIMTNDPTFDKQQENLKQYEGFGGDKPLPGTTEPSDRFVRAAFYIKNLQQPKDLRQAIANILSVTRNASQPFTISLDPKNPYKSATIWRTVGDLTNGYYYYESTVSPYLVWVNFAEFNSVTETRKLDLSKNPDYHGDVSKLFQKADPAELKVPKFD